MLISNVSVWYRTISLMVATVLAFHLWTSWQKWMRKCVVRFVSYALGVIASQRRRLYDFTIGKINLKITVQNYKALRGCFQKEGFSYKFRINNLRSYSMLTKLCVTLLKILHHKKHLSKKTVFNTKNKIFKIGHNYFN